MIFKLIRHGQSQANIKEIDGTKTGDHKIHLTEIGKRQARLAGQRLLAECPNFVQNLLLYQSPYTRSRETMIEILSTFPPEITTQVYEDPRLREVEWGYNKPDGYDKYVDKMRETHGKFYYRMKGGESPADCFDRISTFLETLMRQIKRKNAQRILIISHGITIRCFVMRFMHLTVEQFEQIQNPKNCDIITISNETNLGQFKCGNWHVYGLRIPHDPQGKIYPWECPVYEQSQVWPHLEHNKHFTQCNMCENCGKKLFLS